MKEKRKEIFNQYVFKKENKEEKIKDVLYGRSREINLFKDKNLIIVVSIVTLFLQIISFVTTYQGAKTYFEEIFILAPLLFALSIQIIVYFLANTVSRKATIFMVLSLLLGVTCSTYFSYIGIYNVVNSPQKYLEDIYSKYEFELSEKYQNAQLSIKNQSQDSINELINGIKENVEIQQQKIVMIETMQKEINAVHANISVSMTPPQRYQYVNYEDYVMAYNAYLSTLSTNSQVENDKKITAIIKKFGFKDNQEAISALSNAKSLKNMAITSIAQLAKDIRIENNNFATQIEGLRMYLLTNEEDTIDKMVSQLFNVYAALGGNQLDSSNAISQLIVNQNNHQYEMLSYDDFESLKATNGQSLYLAPMQLKQHMESQISKAINNINTMAELAHDNSLKVNKNDYIIYDMYTLPIINLTNETTRPMALFCLILAALVDLLSIIFALIARKKTTVLNQKKVSSILRGGEEQLSECINDALALSLQRVKHIPLNESLNPEVIVEGLSQFLSYFKTSNLAIQEGYSMICDEKDIEQFSELVSILNQFNELKIIDKKRLFGEDIEGNVVLLKTKFIIWATKRISDTVQVICEVDDDAFI